MKLPPFTLVYRPDRGGVPARERAQRVVDDLGDHAERLSFSLDDVKPTLRRSLLATVGPSSDPAAAVAFLNQAGVDLQRRAAVETVGFWDLSSQVGELPTVVQALNRVQPVLTFFEVQAPVPSGLISRPERVAAWAREKAGEALTGERLAELGNNVIFEDFAVRARKLRRELGLDHLIGIVPAMVAFEEEGELYWNYFSMSEPRLLLASTSGVFEYARRAECPFAVGVAVIALSTLLASLNPELVFHEETRGCFFDFNRDRDSIVEAFRRLEIEPECQAKIRPRYREAAVAMVAALHEIGAPPTTPAPDDGGAPAKRKASSSQRPGARARTRVARQ